MIWLYVSMTGQYTINPYTGKAHFIFSVVSAEKRDMIYNLIRLVGLPVQTLGMIESLIASEHADFTMHDA